MRADVQIHHLSFARLGFLVGKLAPYISALISVRLLSPSRFKSPTDENLSHKVCLFSMLRFGTCVQQREKQKRAAAEVWETTKQEDGPAPFGLTAAVRQAAREIKRARSEFMQFEDDGGKQIPVRNMTECM